MKKSRRNRRVKRNKRAKSRRRKTKFRRRKRGGTRRRKATLGKPPSSAPPPPPPSKSSKKTQKTTSKKQKRVKDVAKITLEALHKKKSKQPAQQPQQTASAETARFLTPKGPITKTGSYLLNEDKGLTGKRRVLGGISESDAAEKKRIKNQPKPTGPWIGKCTKALKKSCRNKKPSPFWCKPCKIQSLVCNNQKAFCKTKPKSNFCNKCPKTSKSGGRRKYKSRKKRRRRRRR